MPSTATLPVPVTAPLRIGRYEVDPAVVLAPMAGITNVAFRQLCREYGSSRSLYVCEMITARAVVERDPKTMRMIAFGPDEHPRSMQLYGVDPRTMGEAVRIIAGEGLADHVDMNFGCPVPKITRKGGGSALPYKRRLFAAIVREAVRAAEPAGIPVTVKFRIGIDDEHHTFLDAGRLAEAEGAMAVALHARTAAQRYSGTADWSAIARLKEAVTTIPVLGNGDIFCADDALRMVRETGCDGVVVGRGCLGRPWLFRELQAALRGEPVPEGPALGEVARVLRRHAELLVAHLGAERGVRDLRKHMAWYLRGFPVGSDLRHAFGLVSTLDELDDLLARLDHAAPFPKDAEGPRGRQGSPARVVLPEGWLDDPEDLTVPAGAELDHSGG
ncbi:tRNA dihydrouridine synthase DusB [Streptoalloteichus hindustanus]|uniref:tRNA-dihydrouridine synthase n=1 Tax=Streptoalloteichus hindustanus TaxID=2017 RepID=A0A1M4U5S3_STRHI|nr:tRNA dihydrouridine synthase DusB [Streptoalloteichus hindustanus]SHE52171.1 putative TIM-barrel protein, nifR3 family [Streptoalloteichus hindustanus]